MFKFRWPALFALACTVLFCTLAFAADAPVDPAPALSDALFAHKWVLVAAIVIGIFVRLCKEDVTFLPTLPARWRPVLALALGVIAGFLMKLEPGKTWSAALLEGGLSAFIAMGGHNVIIEALRNGRELGVPKVAPDAAPTTKLPLDPPSGPTAGAVAFVFVLALGAASSQASCSPAANRKLVNGGLDAVQTACIVQNMWNTIPAIAVACQIADALIPDLKAIVDSMRKQALAGPPACFDAGVCKPDAGP